MATRRMVFFLVFFLFGMAGIANGADVVKIAVIDFQKIVDTSSAGKRSADEIKGEHKKMSESLEEKEGEAEELKKALEQKALAMSQEARDEKERDLRIKVGDLQSLAKKYQDRLRKLELEHASQIQKDCFKIAEEIGEREGYLLILERRFGGVVYAPNTIDITDKVIEAYNAMDAKSAK